MRCSSLGFIKQRQDQTIFRIVLNMGSVWSIIPRPQWPPFAGCLTLAAGQVNNHLVLCKCSCDIENIYKQPLGIPINGLGSRGARACAMSRPGPGPSNLSLRTAGVTGAVVPGAGTPLPPTSSLTWSVATDTPVFTLWPGSPRGWACGP